MDDDMPLAERAAPRNAATVEPGPAPARPERLRDASRGPQSEPQKPVPQRPVPEKPVAAAPAEPMPARPRRRRWLRPALLLLGPLVVLIVGAWLYLSGGRFVGTENAYVHADKVLISAQVAGPVQEVLVHENQRVERGDALFRIDREPFEIALRKAEAELRKVRTEILALKASYREKGEEVGLAHADLKLALQEFDRQEELRQKNVASVAAFDRAAHDRDAARQRIAMLEQEQAQIRASLAGDPDLPLEQHPDFLAAQAGRDAAALDLARTEVKAPFAGVASDKPEPGQYVQPGSPVMSLVADRGLWIEANFKETEITHMRAGQPATVEIDTYPGRTWQATIDSIAQATEAEFSVLPAQNVTGNWVKVVQRIPVRLRIETRPDDPPLRAGMSGYVEVDTGQERSIGRLVERAVAWLAGTSGTGRAAAGTR